VQFIGELYKIKLLKPVIMLSCLELLLQPDDEEKLECFSKLMMTIGEQLEQESENAVAIGQLWQQVLVLAGRAPESEGVKALSLRIRFMLQDLIELKENGWVKRREQERAKTIAQIHMDVAMEEEQSARLRANSFVTRSPKVNRTVRRATSDASSNMFHANSITEFVSNDNSNGQAEAPALPNLSRRVVSSGVTLSPLNNARTRTDAFSLTRQGDISPPSSPLLQNNLSAEKIVEYLEPYECGVKVKSLLHEFLVGGDIDDAVLTIDELVGCDNEGHITRGAAVVESAILAVLERKETDVRKCQALLSRCLSERKLDMAALPLGLNNCLELIRDIEIDAPRAGLFLATFIADWVQAGYIDFSFLLDAPESFLSNCRPAEFAVDILATVTADASDEQVSVVEKLMNEEDSRLHPSVRAWLQGKRLKKNCT
jgi:translation initiation factor 4G